MFNVLIVRRKTMSAFFLLFFVSQTADCDEHSMLDRAALERTTAVAG